MNKALCMMPLEWRVRAGAFIRSLMQPMRTWYWAGCSWARQPPRGGNDGRARILPKHGGRDGLRPEHPPVHRLLNEPGSNHRFT
jgi:hypothetical protein